MNFVSLFFLAYLLLVVLVHFLLPHRFRYLWLLAASYFFYGFANPWLLFLIVGVTLVTYLTALGIHRFPKAKKWLLALAFFVSLGSLFVFKYLDFAIDGVIKLSHLFGSSWQMDALNIILPVGISFYTFQALSYVVDVYREKIEPEKHIGYYALFISYFPQLVAGPIERFDKLMPQLKTERKFDKENLAIGARYLASGYLKKVVVADFLAIAVNAIFGDVLSHDGGALFMATILFAFQIYGDFSGYSDIAKGASKILGIDLMENFNQPYLSSTPREFWRRWHISLSRWFSDYVYIPLGGNRKGRFRECLNLLIVFLLSGLWHGANIKFVIWGALHGVYLIIETLIFGRKKEFSSCWGRWLGRFVTFLLVCFAWIFFRANSLQEAGTIITKIFSGWDGFRGVASIYDAASWVRLAFALLCLFSCAYLPSISFKKSAEHNVYAGLCLVFAVFVIALSWALLYQGGQGGEFIYFQF